MGGGPFAFPILMASVETTRVDAAERSELKLYAKAVRERELQCERLDELIHLTLALQEASQRLPPCGLVLNALPRGSASLVYRGA